METTFRDVTLAVRLLLKQPAFATVAILTLGLGIGGSTAIFSVIDVTLLRPLPYPRPEQLVRIQVEQRQPDGDLSRMTPSIEDMRDWESLGYLFSHLAVSRRVIPPEFVDGPEPQRVNVREITAAYLGLHGVTPILGRDITEDDEREGAPPVVLIGYGFWQSRFGADRNVLGRTIGLNNAPATVIGVLPPAFYRDSTIWRPLRRPALFARRGTGAQLYGRLKPGITLTQAQQTLERLTSSLDRERGRAGPVAIRVESLHDVVTATPRETANILAAAVALILLIACVNVAGLQFARGATRRPELAVRVSMGAGRARLVRQLLTESLVLAIGGGIVGLLIAWGSLDALAATLPISLPSNTAATLNSRVLAFTGMLSLMTGILFGLAPALSLSRVNVTAALARADRRHGSVLSRRTSQTLIIVEVALALVLLAGAGLMIRSFARILAVDVGFDPSSFFTMEAVPVDTSQTGMKQYYPAVVRSIRDLSVDAVGAVDQLPLGGIYTRITAVVDGKETDVDIRQFLPGYFEAIGMALKQGRFPTESDRTSFMPVAVLNETAAKQLFPALTPIGRRFEAGNAAFEIIGVVGDIRHSGHLRPVVPEVYLMFGYREEPAWFGSGALIVVVRASIPTRVLTEQLREAARAGGMPAGVTRIRRGSDWYADQIDQPRKDTVLFGLMGGLGLSLALAGVFGMTAYAVGRRTQEIGVRVAFGATPGRVTLTILRDVFWPVLLGIAFGLGGARVTTHVIASFLFDTAPTDAGTFAAVASILGCAACLAGYVPARRAARIDPVVALRAE